MARKLSEEDQNLVEGFVRRWGKQEALKALRMRSGVVLDDVIAGRGSKDAVEMVSSRLDDLDRVDAYLHACDKDD